MGETVTGLFKLDAKNAGTNAITQIEINFLGDATQAPPSKVCVETLVNAIRRIARDCGMDITLHVNGVPQTGDFKLP